MSDLGTSALARDGTKARNFYWRHNAFVGFVEPGGTKTFRVDLVSGFFSLRYGPEFIIDSSSDNRVERVDITEREGRPSEHVRTVAPGSLIYNLTNATSARIIGTAISITAAEHIALSA